MDWTVTSGVAVTAAAFGVIGSLIFVGFQVRQNSSGLHNAAAQSLMSTYQDLFPNVIDSSDLAEIFLLGSQDPGKLDATSRVRLLGTAINYSAPIKACIGIGSGSGNGVRLTMACSKA